MKRYKNDVLSDNTPMVTVLLTVYNRVTVVSTIKSILAQTYDDFELLIIDNASTDATHKVIKEIKDPRIRLIINEKNKGQTYSMNKGLKLARGKYIARIDADDLMLPERLEKQVAFMESNPEYGLCGSWVQFITDDDRLAMKIKTCTTDIGFRVIQMIGCAAYHPAVLLRRSILDDYNIIYNPEMMISEDYDMWRKIQKHSLCTNLPEILTYYRKGAESDSNKYATIAHKEEYKIRDLLSKEEVIIDIRHIHEILLIEQKTKKSIKDVFKLKKLYSLYLKKNLGKKHCDYGIAKTKVIFRIYGECFIYNNTWWAKFIKKFYELVKKFKYKMAK